MEEIQEFEALRQRVVQLERDAEEAEVRIVAALEPNHIEFVSACDHLEDIDDAVRNLQNDIRYVLTDIDRAVDIAVSSSAEPRDVTALRNRAASLQANLIDVTTILQVHQQARELDKRTSSARYGEAADLSMDIVENLGAIISGNFGNETLLRRAGMIYYQRRAILVKHLEDALNHLCRFGDRVSITRASVVLGESANDLGTVVIGEAVAPTTIADVWQALHTLGLHERHVEHLAEQAKQKLLRPLFEASRKLPHGRKLTPRLHSPTSDTRGWTWMDSPMEDRGSENIRPNNSRDVPVCANKEKDGIRRSCSVQVVLPALCSLLEFAYEYWAGSLSDVFAVFGKTLWPVIFCELVKNFNLSHGDDAQAIEEFEKSMGAKGFIPDTATTLSSHLHEHPHGIGQERRSSVLGEARTSLLKGDFSLIRVGDDEEPEGVMAELKRNPDLEKLVQPWSLDDITLSAQVPFRSVSDNLQQSLSDEQGSSLRLPKMHVSRCTHLLVERIRELAFDIASCIKSGRIESAQDTSILVRELCTLFSTLRPRVLKTKLMDDPQNCAVFMSDCQYLVNALVLIPFTHRDNIPSDWHHLLCFVDVVPRLRRLGQNHFNAMLQHQSTRITSALEQFDLTASITRDRAFVAAEAAIGATIQEINQALQGMSATLSRQLFVEIVARLLNVVCDNLLSKVFRLQETNSSDINCVAMLMRSAAAMANQVSNAFDLPTKDSSGACATRIGSRIPSLLELELVAEVLGRDFFHFHKLRARVLKTMKKEKVVKLLQLSLQPGSMSANEAWVALSGNSLLPPCA